jgi:glycosyltransferase involved in cell wall biosynthesis
MRIAWFTPFHRQSAIGCFSQIVTNKLANKHVVDLWITPQQDTLETRLNTIIYDKRIEIRKKELENYDLCIYNLGDHLYNHLTIYEASKIVPGVVILHDYVMLHFFAGYYLLERKNLSCLAEDFKYYYGNIAESKLVSSIKNGKRPAWEDDYFAFKYPMFEKATQGAYAVITHSLFSYRKLIEYKGSSVFHQKLPFHVQPRRQKQITNQKLKLLTVGNVNPNKLIHTVIQSIGRSSKLKNKVEYNIIGSEANKSYVNLLKDLIIKYNLSTQVKLHGFLPKARLNHYLEQADLIINLREPALEGGSWSVLESMSYKKPVIVNKTGFYAELPSGSVYKVNIKEEDVSSLLQALEKLVDNSKLRNKLSIEAYNYVLLNHKISAYTDGLNEVIKMVVNTTPKFSLIDKVTEAVADLSPSNSEVSLDPVIKFLVSFIGDQK